MFDPQFYGPEFAKFLAVDRDRPLDAGRVDRVMAGLLRDTSTVQLFAHAKLANREAAEACLAGLWLLADDLEGSHTISQSLHTSEGSFWHGIMHRREGDFSNAKYWFRGVGHHVVFDELTPVVAALTGGHPALQYCDPWDPAAFVDACQAARREADLAPTCRQLQQSEWELLFDYCYHQAVGQ